MDKIVISNEAFKILFNNVNLDALLTEESKQCFNFINKEFVLNHMSLFNEACIKNIARHRECFDLSIDDINDIKNQCNLLHKNC